MASMNIGTNFSADFGEIFLSFALEMPFQHFFSLVNGKLGAFTPEILHNNGMYDDFLR